MNDTDLKGGLETLGRRLGYEFTDVALLRRALAHRSWCAEVGGQPSNERLEFLGDAVLGWVVAEIAYRRHGDLPEGKLTDLRKSVVNAVALAQVAESIGPSNTAVAVSAVGRSAATTVCVCQWLHGV